MSPSNTVNCKRRNTRIKSITLITLRTSDTSRLDPVAAVIASKSAVMGGLTSPPTNALPFDSSLATLLTLLTLLTMLKYADRMAFTDSNPATSLNRW